MCYRHNTQYFCGHTLTTYQHHPACLHQLRNFLQSSGSHAYTSCKGVAAPFGYTKHIFSDKLCAACSIPKSLQPGNQPLAKRNLHFDLGCGCGIKRKPVASSSRLHLLSKNKEMVLEKSLEHVSWTAVPGYAGGIEELVHELEATEAVLSEDEVVSEVSSSSRSSTIPSISITPPPKETSQHQLQEHLPVQPQPQHHPALPTTPPNKPLPPLPSALLISMPSPWQTPPIKRRALPAQPSSSPTTLPDNAAITQRVDETVEQLLSRVNAALRLREVVLETPRRVVVTLPNAEIEMEGNSKAKEGAPVRSPQPPQDPPLLSSKKKEGTTTAPKPQPVSTSPAADPALPANPAHLAASPTPNTQAPSPPSTSAVPSPAKPAAALSPTIPSNKPQKQKPYPWFCRSHKSSSAIDDPWRCTRCTKNRASARARVPKP